MIYLKLFLSFLKIGAVSFGGGYGMLSLIRETVLNNGWLTEKEILNFIAVSESTPGPIAINMATFIGSSQAGVPGAVLATLGVVLPAFTIILVIAAIIKNLMKKKGVEAFLSGVRPCVVALIIGTAFTLALSTVFGISGKAFKPDFDFKALIVFVVITVIGTVIKYILKKKPKPILLIIVSAVLGMLLYSI